MRAVLASPRLWTVCVLQLLIGAVLGSQSLRAQSQLVDKFERAYNVFQKKALVGTDGYILRREPVYALTVSLEPITDAFENVPEAVTHQAEKRVKGRYVLASARDACVYVSSNRDFADTPCTKRLSPVGPALPKWYPTAVTSDSVRLNYGSIHYNAWVSIALIDAYQATGKKTYLDDAHHILRASVQHVDPETGKAYRFRTDDDRPTYVAMIQSWLMQAVRAYLQSTMENGGTSASLQASLQSLAETYEHTSRGVWNHWTSSRIGQLIAEDVRDTAVVDYQKVRDELAELRRQVRREGKIPYIMSPNHPEFPDHRPTYLTYDLRLIAKLDLMASIETGIEPHFGPMLEEAAEVNYDDYFGNNTYAAFYAFLAFDQSIDRFMNRQRNHPFLGRAPHTVSEAVGQIQGIAALLRYDQEVNSCPDEIGAGGPNFQDRAGFEKNAIHYECATRNPGTDG